MKRGKFFLWKSAFIVHQRLHTGKKYYNCNNAEKHLCPTFKIELMRQFTQGSVVVYTLSAMTLTYENIRKLTKVKNPMEVVM